jgi:hypothetical protein
MDHRWAQNHERSEERDQMVVDDNFVLVLMHRLWAFAVLLFCSLLTSPLTLSLWVLSFVSNEQAHPTACLRPPYSSYHLFLGSLTISLGSIITLVHDQILRLVVFTAGEVALEDSFRACSVTFLSID